MNEGGGACEPYTLSNALVSRLLNPRYYLVLYSFNATS